MKHVLSLIRLAFLLVPFLAATSAFAFYDPTIGKWISRDPIGERGGANLNAFCNNDPGSFIDLDGLQVLRLPATEKPPPIFGIPDYPMPELPQQPIPPEYQLPPGTPPSLGFVGGYFKKYGGSISITANECCDGNGHIVQYHVVELCGGVGYGKWSGGMGPGLISVSAGQGCPPKSRWYFKGNYTFAPNSFIGPGLTVWGTLNPKEGGAGLDFFFGSGRGGAITICHASVVNVVTTADCCDKTWQFPPDPLKPPPSPSIPSPDSPIWNYLF